MIHVLPGSADTATYVGSQTSFPEKTKTNQNTQVLNVTEMRGYKVHKTLQGVSRAIVAQWQRQPLTLVSLGIVWSPWPLIISWQQMLHVPK